MNYPQSFENALSARVQVSEIEFLSALKPLAGVFETLRIRYYIVGSVASSAYGLPRSSLDIDLVADIKIHQVAALEKALGAAYYIDPDQIVDAISRKSSFNLIHFETSLKLDIFIPQDRDFDRQALERRRLDSLEIDKPAEYYLSSPEDVILAKFEWYRKGGRVLERQWNDILGVFKVQGEALDMNYLRRWALTLGLKDLLEEALTSVSSA